MTAILILLAIVSGLGGLLFLSEATTGVGFIGFACLLAIFARLVQADRQHAELKGKLDEVNKV